MNPLLDDFNTPFDTLPFDTIRPEHFAPAFDLAFKEARQDIQQIREETETPDFHNTIEKLDFSGERLGRLSALLFNLNHAETGDAIQQLAREMAPRLTAFHNDITLDPVLFEKVKQVDQHKDSFSLTGEQRMLLEKTHKNFVRSGANLDEKQKEEFREITGRLSELSVAFSENVLAETNAYMLHIIDSIDLEGLPEGIVQMASDEAKHRKMKGWVFTLQFPSYFPFMKYAENRDLRHEMYRASGRRGLQNNAYDNRELIREIVRLRFRMARLIGYTSFASFVLDNRMAENESRVYKLLNTLKEAYLPAARLEVNELRDFARSLDGNGELMPWDWSYYSEKLKEKKFSISDEITRPYFELKQSVKAVFELAHRLYGTRFILNDQISKYHEELEVYEVRDEGDEHLAVLYMDYFPRTGKKPGAWMTEFRQQHIRHQQDIRPQVSLVFNFPRPSKEKPSLLSYSEVRTLLHEFGHALHGIFSRVNYQALSGTSVYRDFVELPSQIMENWAEQKEWLQQAGKHYRTGQAMDEHLIDKILASRNFHEGYMGIRQLSFGMLDMAWHSLTEEFSGEIVPFEKQSIQAYRLLPDPGETAMSPSFNHIFAGGYAAGYYGYKWAEVLDADAFSRFMEEGIFNRKVAGEFRDKVLSRGGTKHPMQLYTDFMGREPEVDALLKRSGFSD